MFTDIVAMCPCTGVSTRVYVWDLQDEEQDLVTAEDTETKASALTVVKELAGKRITDISVGGSHVGVVTAKGGVFTWGDNAEGQLGTGDEESTTIPAWIVIAAKIVSLECSAEHSVALSDDGRIFTWGCGISGRLGHGSGKRKHNCNMRTVLTLPFCLPFCDVHYRTERV